MNLHTYAIRTMKEDGCLVEKRFQAIVETLETAYRCLEDLMDDPIFLDTIHGDQELALDQALELIDRKSIADSGCRCDDGPWTICPVHPCKCSRKYLDNP